MWGARIGHSSRLASGADRVCERRVHGDRQVHTHSALPFFCVGLPRIFMSHQNRHESRVFPSLSHLHVHSACSVPHPQRKGLASPRCTHTCTLTHRRARTRGRGHRCRGAGRTTVGPCGASSVSLLFPFLQRFCSGLGATGKQLPSDAFSSGK